MESKWLRVNRDHPCGVCGRTDWDTYMVRKDGSILACCMRTVSPKVAKNGGYLHVIKADAKAPIPPKKAEPIIPVNMEFLWRVWRDKTTPEQIESEAFALGVSMDSMDDLGAAWAPEHAAWAFPMREPHGKIVGIRLRAKDGKKWSVRGSRQGLFLPASEPGRTLTIVEGASDQMAASTLGFSAIGRPSCLGAEQMILDYIKLKRVQRVQIFSDNDNKANNYAGQRGAEKLQAMLPVPSIIWSQPQKDLRDFLREGGTRQLITSMTQDIIWTMPKGER